MAFLWSGFLPTVPDELEYFIRVSVTFCVTRKNEEPGQKPPSRKDKNPGMQLVLVTDENANFLQSHSFSKSFFFYTRKSTLTGGYFPCVLAIIFISGTSNKLDQQMTLSLGVKIVPYWCPEGKIECPLNCTWPLLLTHFVFSWWINVSKAYLA